MTSKDSKLIAIVLVAIVVAGGLGYWMLVPNMPSEIASYTTQQTSFSSTHEQTLVSSTLSTAIATETTLWLNVSATRQVSNYLALLESNGSQPYVQLAKELRKLPDLKNATAVAKIVYLALNATNPEVKEAFELMIKGGTPDPRDFAYPVPNYNTELQVLYWLALQNEFKQDDTLAHAVAMSNGLWVTIGNDEVRQAIKKDTNNLLSFFRETNELQKQKGYCQLENYPLIALFDLAWTGGVGQVHSAYRLIDYDRMRIDLQAYRWNTVSIATLRHMQRLVFQNSWDRKDVSQTVGNLEYYFYFTDRTQNGSSAHWAYADPSMRGTSQYVTIDGKRTWNHHINNIDWQFKNYSEHGRGVGNCGDETGVIDAFAKSVGIATRPIQKWRVSPVQEAHMHVLYFNPKNDNYEAYPLQISTVGYIDSEAPRFSIWGPPVRQQGYLRSYQLADNFVWVDTSFKIPANMTYTQLYHELYWRGIPAPLLRSMYA